MSDKLKVKEPRRTEVDMLPAELPRHRFDVEEYHRMGEARLFTEDDRVELIRGEIADMTPTGASHVAFVTNFTHILVERAGGRYFVSVQNSFGAVDDSEPQPDFTLLRRRPSQGDEAIPAGEDVFVGFEISDTTLAYDRNVKRPPYAETGIQEAWIVDLEGKKIEVHSEPSAEGDKAMRLFVAGEEALSTAIEGLSVPVDEVMA